MELRSDLKRLITMAGLLSAAMGSLSATATTAASVDARFALVGTGGAPFAAKFGFRYYTLEGNYAAGKGTVFSSVDPGNDPAAGFSVVREVAKLNVRTDALGQTNVQFQAKLNQYAKDLAVWYLTPSWARGSKPAFAWYSPNATALIQAESLQIVETIRREKAKIPAITGTVWEIGNEPNLFPAITAAEYGAIFANYYRVIKAEDPAAKVAMGSIFMPEPSTDLKAKFAEELESKMRTELQAAGYYNTLNSSGVFANLVNDVKNTLLARMLALPAKEYLRQALAAAKAVHAAAGAPDIVTYHVYPYDDRAPFQDSAALHAVIDTTVAGINDVLAAAGSPAPLWITEFGNIEQGLTETQVADRMRMVIGAFWDDAAIAMWFHYKSTGYDDQFALFSSGPAPITRLAMDAAFGPASGDFPCDKLNAVGSAYWKASHGGDACADPVAVPDPEPNRDPGTHPNPNPDPDPIPVPIPAHVTILDSLRPSILNPEASALSSSGSIGWAWERAPVPELPGATAASVLARMEIYRDTSATPLLRADSLAASLIKPQLAVGSGPIWVRVRLSGVGGAETEWSAWRLLHWEAAPSAFVPLGNTHVRPGETGRAPWLRDASGEAVDARGRRLAPQAR